MLMGSSGFKALLFITPRLPGFSLMTFSSKSSNSWPDAEVRQPWIIPVPACSRLSSAAQTHSLHPQNYALGSQNICTCILLILILKKGHVRKNFSHASVDAYRELPYSATSAQRLLSPKPSHSPTTYPSNSMCHITIQYNIQTN